MSLAYIRDHYGVPARRNGRIRYAAAGQLGTIVAARGQYLRVRFDGDDRIDTLHPTWEIEHLPAEEATP